MPRGWRRPDSPPPPRHPSDREETLGSRGRLRRARRLPPGPRETAGRAGKGARVPAGAVPCGGHPSHHGRLPAPRATGRRRGAPDRCFAGSLRKPRIARAGVRVLPAAPGVRLPLPRPRRPAPPAPLPAVPPPRRSRHRPRRSLLRRDAGPRTVRVSPRPAAIGPGVRVPAFCGPVPLVVDVTAGRAGGGRPRARRPRPRAPGRGDRSPGRPGGRRHPVSGRPRTVRRRHGVEEPRRAGCRRRGAFGRTRRFSAAAPAGGRP